MAMSMSRQADLAIAGAVFETMPHATGDLDRVWFSINKSVTTLLLIGIRAFASHFPRMLAEFTKI